MRIECSYTDLMMTDLLKPHPANRNKHTDKQIKALSKIIAKVGQRSPIVVSNRSGYIVKGHGRLEAIKLLGWEKCAVDFQDYETELEEFNDRIADNEIARYAEFDHAGFKLDFSDFELDIIGTDFEEFGLLDYSFPDIEPVDLPSLEGKDPDCQQMTFILSNYQADMVKESITKMIGSDEFLLDGINGNKNGTAISLICERYNNGH